MQIYYRLLLDSFRVSPMMLLGMIHRCFPNKQSA